MEFINEIGRTAGSLGCMLYKNLTVFSIFILYSLPGTGRDLKRKRKC